jgi:hypothetical protein
MVGFMHGYYAHVYVYVGCLLFALKKFFFWNTDAVKYKILHMHIWLLFMDKHILRLRRGGGGGYNWPTTFHISQECLKTFKTFISYYKSI